MLSRYFSLLSVLFFLVSWSVFLPVNVSAQDAEICPCTNSAILATGSINCTATSQAVIYLFLFRKD